MKRMVFLMLTLTFIFSVSLVGAADVDINISVPPPPPPPPPPVRKDPRPLNLFRNILNRKYRLKFHLHPFAICRAA